MNPPDDPLRRLLQAAAKAPADLPTEAPFSVAQSIRLGRGRRARAAMDDWLALLPMVRGAMLGACLVAFAAAAFVFWDADSGSSDEAVFIEAQADLDDGPEP